MDSFSPFSPFSPLSPFTPDISVQAFDALHDQPQLWREAIHTLARQHGGGPVQQMTSGTVLVALLGSERVLKLYPPFLQDHFAFEEAALLHLRGHVQERLRVPTPQLLASGRFEGWPYLLMTQLQGAPLTDCWPTLPELQRCQVLREIGALAAQVHALPLGVMATLAQPWPVFVQHQRSGAVARQHRTGLPPHLLAQVPDFVQGTLPTSPAVMLTGEYTPMNLLVHTTEHGCTLSGMFDFGDGLVGPREYDWLGPLCFLAAGSASRCAAFAAGAGFTLSAQLQQQLLRLLLLHRYSNLAAQIACPGWQQCQRLEDLGALIWPIA
jgi:hygromycin-B 7''-O-kinase